mgnify:CR=1 FL=1|tara:strand:+ start:1490 stop:2398 length:909 start_codon:yes stop_codon:yes gene_type:complete
MIEYLCHRCGYNTNKKSNINQHLNRKTICKPMLSDISIEDIKIYYNLEISITSKITSNNSKSLICPSKNLKNTPKNVVNKCCSYCCKEFSRIDNLNRHLKKCKMKNNVLSENKELRETVEKLLIECSEMKNLLKNTTEKSITSHSMSNSNNTNSNNTNNTNNNTIIINNYGEEDTNYITTDFILKLLKNKPFKAIPEMIKHTHFNKEHPENQNIKITNKKEPYVKIMKNNKWELQDRRNTITDLIDKQHIKINDEKIDEKIEHQCTPQEKINIERCNKNYEDDEEDYIKRLYNESELVMLNN